MKFWLFRFDVISVSRIEFGLMSGMIFMLCLCVWCISNVLGLVMVG